MAILFNPNITANKVVVIGAGGTGSRFIPKAAQFLAHNKLTPGATMYVVDDDVVEEKNCVRQNFIKMDVGKNKADVVATRYSKAFGVKVISVPSKFEFHASESNRITRYTDIPGISANDDLVVVICVDKVAARRDLLKAGLEHAGKIVFLDAGNEATYGQVRVFTNSIFSCRPGSSEEEDFFSKESFQKAYGLELEDVLHQSLFEGVTLGEQPFAQDFLHLYLSSPENILSHSGIGYGLTVNMTVHSDLSPDSSRIYSSRLNTSAKQNLLELLAQKFPPALPGMPRLLEEAGFDRNIVLEEWPIPFKFYLSLQDGEGESCADLDQTLAVNDLASATLMGLFQTIGYKLPLNNCESYFTVTGSGSYNPFSTKELLNSVILDFVDLPLYFKDGSPLDLVSYRSPNTEITLTPSQCYRYMQEAYLSNEGFEGKSFPQYLQSLVFKNDVAVSNSRGVCYLKQQLSTALGKAYKKEILETVQRSVLERVAVHFSEEDLRKYRNLILTGLTSSIMQFNERTQNLYALSEEELRQLSVNPDEYLGPDQGADPLPEVTITHPEESDEESPLEDAEDAEDAEEVPFEQG